MAPAKEVSDVIPPAPRVKLVWVPLACVICRVEEPTDAAAVDRGDEYQAAELARLCTVIVWLPGAAPGDATAVSTELLLDAAVRAASAPAGSFRLLRSVLSLERALWMEPSAVIWD